MPWRTLSLCGFKEYQQVPPRWAKRFRAPCRDPTFAAAAKGGKNAAFGVASLARCNPPPTFPESTFPIVGACCEQKAYLIGLGREKKLSVTPSVSQTPLTALTAPVGYTGQLFLSIPIRLNETLFADGTSIGHRHPLKGVPGGNKARAACRLPPGVPFGFFSARAEKKLGGRSRRNSRL
jgi:hypothetical protein